MQIETIETHNRAPFLIGLEKKSTDISREREHAMQLACIAARGVGQTLPVIHGNRIIGWVRGHQDSPKVEFITGINDLINAATVNGQRLSQQFMKIGPTINLIVGTWYDLYPLGPGGGTYTGSALTARQFTDTSAGAIPHGGNVSTKVKVLTGGWAGFTLIGGTLLLYDRVLTYEACTLSGGLQSMTNTLAAQRYISAGQSGLQIMPTLQTAIGASGVNISALVYTDNAGNTGHTIPTSTALTLDSTIANAPTSAIPAQMVVNYANNAAANCLFLPLAAGDSGCRLITSFTTSASTTGTFTFALVRPIAYLPLASLGVGSQYDFVRQVATLERIYDGASLHWAVNSTINNDVTLFGALDFVWV